MQTQQTKIIRLPAVMERTGLSKCYIYKLIRRGGFPASVRIAPRYAGWIESEVDAWLHQRIAAARGQ